MERKISTTTLPGSGHSAPETPLVWWAARLAACWRQKLLLTLALNLFFWGGYLFLSRHALFPARALKQTWVDLAVGFNPGPWSWVYLSQFLYTMTIPWLIQERTDLCRYVSGLAILCGVSFLIFLFFPVQAPRPEAIHAGQAWAVIVGCDGPLNSFPSLHAGFMVYTYALGWRLFRRHLPGVALLAFVLWGALILYSTLATKQHYAWDLAAGALLGYCSDWFAWRDFGKRKAAATIDSKKGEISQTGER